MSEEYVETKLEFLLWKAVSLSVTVIFSILIIIAAGLAISIEAKAEEIQYPTLPGTSSIRDYSKPTIIWEGNEGYSSLPGTTNIQDLHGQRYIREGHEYDDMDYDRYDDYDY